ncbi:MAG: hypothetical protein ACK5CE_20940 [Actinomycetes bacterium]|uniref:Unannotated protein n=1 Tax=freshwater metagenome TaxID=449393 RepID=A0A6J6D9H3_9ZZZZ|nr:hypothetical protein [Actinomycetota bacterium]
MNERQLQLLKSRPGWNEALARLQDLLQSHGDRAKVNAMGFGIVYRDRRAAMVVDVIGSRQRRYESRVIGPGGIVETFESAGETSTLAELASCSSFDGLGLRDGEAKTIRDVATGLFRYASERGLGEEEGVRQWADSTASLDLAFRLDPYVGIVSGIGSALFAYLRMRSGGDGIKPDVRVRQALTALGFDPPPGDAALLAVCHAVAATTDIELLVLDQLLWFADRR